MEKENKKLSNQQIISIICLVVIVICVINAFFLDYAGVIHVKFDSVDDYVITFGLSIVTITCLNCMLGAKSSKESFGYSDDYSFIKSEIDKLHFDTPSQMADYFCKNFKDYPSFECTLRMVVFAYNYFKIEELNKKDDRFWYEVAKFNDGFKNPDALKEYIDVSSTINIEDCINSYNDINGLVYNLFNNSKLHNRYFDLFEEKDNIAKYKI